MVIDATAIILLAFFALSGAMTGAMTQVLALGAAIATYFFAPMIAEIMMPSVARALPAAADPVLSGVSLIVAAVGFYVALRILIWVFVAMIHGVSTVLQATDRLAGAAIGTAKGALLIFLVAQGLFLVLERSPTMTATFAPTTERSTVMHVAEQVDLSSLIVER